MRIDEQIIWCSDAGLEVTLAPHLELAITEVTGLDGLKNEVSTSKAAGQDGVTQNGMSLEARNITLSGALRGAALSTQQLRTQLLTAFTPKAKGTLQYVDAQRTYSIRAAVDQAPQFVEDEVGTNFFVSLLCSMPYLEDTGGATKHLLATWESMIEFPLEIDDANKLEFEQRRPSVIVNIPNPGHVEAGMQVTFSAAGRVVNPEIRHMTTHEIILLGVTMNAGERIRVDTRYGRKGVHFTDASGVMVPKFQLLDPDSTFMLLRTGDNLIRYGAKDGVDALNVDILLSPYYLGV